MERMSRFRSASFLLATVAIGSGHAQSGPAASAAAVANTLTHAEHQAGWTLLFDGTSTAGWRNYLKPGLSEGWRAVDGALTRVGRAGDIVTQGIYRNFELLVDWKTERGGNSGIFYRGIEGPLAIYYSAPEMQVLDDDVHPDGKSPLTSAGAAYGLYPAPRGAVRPHLHRPVQTTT